MEDHFQSGRSNDRAEQCVVVQLHTATVIPQHLEAKVVIDFRGGLVVEGRFWGCWVKRLKPQGTHMSRDSHPRYKQAVFQRSGQL